MNPIQFSEIKAPQVVSQPNPGAGEGKQGSFAEMLSEAVDRVGELQNEADLELRRLLRGEAVDLHQVLLAGERAGLASQLMMSIRNKLVDAYHEVMRMQV